MPVEVAGVQHTTIALSAALDVNDDEAKAPDDAPDAAPDVAAEVDEDEDGLADDGSCDGGASEVAIISIGPPPPPLAYPIIDDDRSKDARSDSG